MHELTDQKTVYQKRHEETIRELEGNIARYKNACESLRNDISQMERDLQQVLWCCSPS